MWHLTQQQRQQRQQVAWVQPRMVPQQTQTQKQQQLTLQG
jgi:hypothetical protein